MKTLYIDMDNVLVDFKTGIERLDQAVLEAHILAYGTDERGNPRDLDDVPGIFSLMDPVRGAVEAVLELVDYFDTYVLSTSPWNNPTAWSDKLLWIQRHFGKTEESPLHKRLILSHHKNLNEGHFLVDDRQMHGADLFGARPGSEHIHFGQPGFENWEVVVNYLLARR